MKKLHFNPSTLMGEFLGNSSSLVIEVLNTFNITKSVPIQIGEQHKLNNELLPLYYKDIFKEVPYKEFLYNEETTEVTDTPIMELKHKSNAEGQLLYLEAICNDLGEEIDFFETTNMMSASGKLNKPLTEEVQKTSLSGSPMYYKAIYEDKIRLVYERTDEVTEITNKPVMEPIYDNVTYNLVDNMDKFSFEEVLTEKLQGDLEESQFDYVICERFLTPDNLDMDTSVCSHGIGFVHIPEGESINFKPIPLGCNCSDFELLSALPEGIKVYANTKLVRDGNVSLARSQNVLKLKVTNTTNEPIVLKELCIGYKEVVTNVTP